MAAQTTKQQFVDKREQRDHQLPEPRLVAPALTYNLTASIFEKRQRVHH
ncbi:hypothetical protein L4C42_15085 [Vibrio wakamikoensis]|uniref:Uncharacterized protein n=1 Tax=Vibrio chaetopteri TaxID=3016528 RepID=A0AAU8BLZ5_9VIBR